jgi:hypothetical protein
MGQKYFAIGFALAALLSAAFPAYSHAQAASQGLGAMPKLGSLSTPQGQVSGASTASSTDPALSVNDTYVSFIDSAVPRNVVGMRFDDNLHNVQPMRALYIHPASGVPNNVGFPLMETKISYQELTSFAEYSLASWFSGFVEAPYRWLNPDINDNQSGASDMRYGLKVCTWSSDSLIATILFRIYQPTAASSTLGTGHWSLEPGMLLAYRVSSMLHLEGEMRYWIPLTRSDVGGQVARYGLGISYGQRKASGLWFAPVLEAIGWTVVSGQTAVATSATDYVLQEAHGQTIANGYLGLRWGWGSSIDFYAGYGRSFTGQTWARDTIRFEMRYSY